MAKRFHTPESTTPTHRTLVTPNHSSQVLQTLQHMYKDEKLCDYTIIAEGQAFRTHRNLLASVSDYFSVMLTGTMLEARQDHVDLRGVSASAMRVLLDFMYSGQLTLCLEDVVDVLSAACHLQMRTATDLACDFLLSELSTRTCVDILNIADMFSLQPVLSTCLQHILSNFNKVSDSDQMVKLQTCHLEEILRSDELCGVTELSLFWALMRWIEHEPGVRGETSTDLLQYVRFSLMRPEELVDHVASTKYMSEGAPCRALLDEALRYHVLPSRHPLLQTPRTRVRNSPSMVGFGGRYGIRVGYNYNCNKMYVLCNHGDHGNRKWVKLPSCDRNFLYAAVTVVDNFMYVCGGMGKPAHATATSQRFDPRTCSWSRLARMKTRRQSFPLVGFDGQLFVFGGGTPSGQSLEHPPTAKCELYSIDKNEWQTIAPLPERRKSSSACQYLGDVYLSGGHNQSETCSQLWCYSLDQNSWTVKAPMLSPHAGHAMVSLGNKLYVVDRTDHAIEIYHPDEDVWSKVTGAQVPVSGVARPAILEPWVYFLSYVQQDSTHKCTRLNLLTQQTESLPDYPESVYCVAGVALAFPRQRLLDSTNNSSNTSSTSASFTS